MKKLILFLTLILSIFCFVGCGQNEPNKPTNTKYTITFRQEGQEDVKKSIIVGEKLSKSEIPTPALVDGYYVEWEIQDFSNITTDTVVNAKITFTITFKNGEEILKVIKLNKGQNLAKDSSELPKVPENKKWDRDFSLITSNEEVNSINLETYTVSFKVDNVIKATREVVEGGTLPQNDLPKIIDGYIARWNITNNDLNNIIKNIEVNGLLYFEITFINEEQALKKIEVEKGQNLAKDDERIPYLPKNYYWSVNYWELDNYAVVQALIQYIITYDVSKYSFLSLESTTQIVKNGENFVLYTPNVNNKYADFICWMLEVDGKKEKFESGVYTLEKDITLVPKIIKWTKPY